MDRFTIPLLICRLRQVVRETLGEIDQRWQRQLNDENRHERCAMVGDAENPIEASLKGTDNAHELPLAPAAVCRIS
jgi:ribose 1,5-bisphosphokinase PhnN